MRAQLLTGATRRDAKRRDSTRTRTSDKLSRATGTAAERESQLQLIMLAGDSLLRLRRQLRTEAS